MSAPACQSAGEGMAASAAIPPFSELAYSIMEILLLTRNIHKTIATKAELRTAVTTILRGEDVNAAKPGPRLTPTKRRQIEAVEKYRATHRGATLHNACLRSFVRAKDGYKSWKAMYVVLNRESNN